MQKSAEWVEEGRHLLPRQKHALVRVVPYVLNLLDSLKDANIFRSKDLKLERFIKLFRLHPVVPLYGDMQIDLEVFLIFFFNFQKLRNKLTRENKNLPSS